ncbi:MAG: hypothetical protein CVT67_02150 [Actinobacteria bacterium HGW-Actinobacteria-7]|jgi:hypothetical protein|nr:MAG: hypothetical protein CVT67_02150 [Actinobacteria bacterium HGW-Actinobacteria-7]
MQKTTTKGTDMKRWTAALMIPGALVTVLALGGCAGSNVAKVGGNPTASSIATSATTGSSGASGADSDGDGIPDSAEALLGTDPQNPDTDGDGQTDKVDPAPLKADSPISETSTTKGFKIDAVLAENNVDSGGAAVDDHLELTVTNTTNADITDGWDLYYTMTDQVTKEVQSFYLKLPGFSIKAGQTAHLHVDTKEQPGHFRADPNTSFYKGQNALVIETTLHASGFAPQTSSVKKDAAGAEAGGD